MEGNFDPIKMLNPNGTIKRPEAIKLSSKASLSLRNSLETLDLIPELDEKINQPQRIDDIFKMASIKKGNKIDNKSSENLEDINQFNLNIIKNNKWGGDESAGKINRNRPIIKPPKVTLSNKFGK
jgi:hypothetical protein